MFGKVNTFSIKIKVLNKGESAFLSKMNIVFPSDFTAAGVDFVNVSIFVRQINLDSHMEIC